VIQVSELAQHDPGKREAEFWSILVNLCTHLDQNGLAKNHAGRVSLGETDLWRAVEAASASTRALRATDRLQAVAAS
jgi:hypothetical protein